MNAIQYFDWGGERIDILKLIYEEIPLDSWEEPPFAFVNYTTKSSEYLSNAAFIHKELVVNTPQREIHIIRLKAEIYKAIASRAMMKSVSFIGCKNIRKYIDIISVGMKGVSLTQNKYSNSEGTFFETDLLEMQDTMIIDLFINLKR